MQRNFLHSEGTGGGAGLPPGIGGAVKLSGLAVARVTLGHLDQKPKSNHDSSYLLLVPAALREWW
jgi:hypothetical protein